MTRIGVIEDSAALRELLSEILSKRGYEISPYPSIAEARALFSSPPDLLISDVRLTDGNGVEFVQDMRTTLGDAAPPVLMLSALGSEEDMLRAFDAGADEYLTKPVSMGELLAKCSMLLARRTKRQAPSPRTQLPGGELAFGRYRITKSLGRGSFGEVYDAHDTKTDQRVALKVLDPIRGAELVHRQRFLRESYTLSVIRSPNIMGLLDYGEQEGRLYAALEFIEGKTLTQYVAEHGPLSNAQLRGLLQGVAKGLQVIGDRGLIHRDLKPDNVVLRDGDPAHPVLIDFGLAKSAGDHMLTEAGTLLGTPAFMSPEQIAAAELDGRSDQFSLGLTVAFAASGKRAFPELTGVQLLAALSTREVALPPSLTPDLQACLRRMTRLLRNQRYPHPQALLRDLLEHGSPQRVGC